MKRTTSLNRMIGYFEYDNLDQVIVSEVYDGDNVTITSTSGVPNRPSSSLLRAKTVNSFDEWGRVYKSETYSVNPSSGAVSSNALTTNVWYDSRGNVIKTSAPGGLVSKAEYDGVNRVTKQYTTDGGGDSAYGDADDVTSDNVLSQVEMTYDSVGNVLMVTSRQRFHDETGTGALGTPTTGVKARVSYSTAYYDKADRLTATVDVGTNGGSAYTRPGSVPSRSDTVLVTSVTYDSAGMVYEVTDPKGIVTRTTYDDLGRAIKVIENYVNGTPSDNDDKTVEYTYNGNDQVTTLKAYLTGGGYQTTEWVYGVTGSTINSNDLLKEMRYPDASTGNASSTEKDSYTYNALGQILTSTDRNGNVHTYGYDILGRFVSDTVSTLGSNVDGSVRRLEIAYDTQGNAYLLTSYDATSGGNIVNEVKREFNGLGQLTSEWQSHSGAVTGSTPRVQYTYSEMTGGANHSRLTSIIYPNGRTITYDYSSGLNNNISRLSSITDGATTLESYEYLGLDIVVKRAHAQPGIDLTYIKQTGESDGDAGDKYIGLDRFYRIVDQRWRSSSADVDRYQYGYDRNSNRLWRDNLVNSAFGELYAYDNLNQLTSMDRGTLNGTKTGLTGAASRSQDWDYDALGNWDSVTTDSSTQTRGHNAQNEITSISGATTPTYDANGNLTKDETGRTFKYDAWNRLVEVKTSGGSTIVTYKYDALFRRVSETKGANTRDFYYSTSWQVLEEKLNGTTDTSYVWSPIYVDAMIARDRDTDANGSLDERLYVLHDANFNVTALVSTSGTVVERYAYDSFGNVTVYDGSWNVRVSGSSYGWIYLHQGGRWESQTGLYSFGFREYSPTLGRWIQMDPIDFFAGDLNLQRYVGNNPTNLTDPSGLIWWYLFAGFFLGAGTAQAPGPNDDRRSNGLDWGGPWWIFGGAGILAGGRGGFWGGAAIGGGRAIGQGGQVVLGAARNGFAAGLMAGAPFMVGGAAAIQNLYQRLQTWYHQNLPRINRFADGLREFLKAMFDPGYMGRQSGTIPRSNHFRQIVDEIDKIEKTLRRGRGGRFQEALKDRLEELKNGLPANIRDKVDELQIAKKVQRDATIDEVNDAQRKIRDKISQIQQELNDLINEVCPK